MTNIDTEVMNEAFEWQALQADVQLSARERRAFSAWLAADPRHRAAFDEARRFWDDLGYMDRSALDEDFFRPSLRERVRSLLWRTCRAARQCTPRRTLPAAGALAGVCALVLAVFLAVPNHTPSSLQAVSEYRAAVGQLRAVDLEDGSRITLGADTAVNVRFSTEARTVEMGPGEAYFKVAKDRKRPFTVSSGNLRVTVHGTAFEVRRTAESASVSVTEGVVSVSVPDSPSGEIRRREVLTAGEKLTVLTADGRLQVAMVKPDGIGAWRNNLLVYRDAPLSEIVADMNRYRHKRISIREKDIAAIRVTATFNSNDVDGMLTSLTELFPLRLERLENETVIRHSR